jgi:hypothetical protein
MRQVVNDERLRERVSMAAMQTIRDEFSPESVGRRIRARLEYVQSVLASR